MAHRDHATVLRLLVKRHRDLAQLRNKHCSRFHALLLEFAAGGSAVRSVLPRLVSCWIVSLLPIRQRHVGS